MLWAESLACFGLYLKGSDYKGNASIDLARSLAEQTSYGKDALKVEYMDLLDEAEDIYEGNGEIGHDDDCYDDDDYGYYDDNDVNVIDAD